MKRDESIAYILYLVFVFILGGSGLIIFNYEYDGFYQSVDDKLLSVAKGSTYLLSPDFHDRALTPEAVNAAEDLRNIRRLTRIAKYYGVSGVYTMIDKNGTIYFTSSSATDMRLKRDKNLTHYFDLCQQASSTVKKAFKNEKTVFVEKSDHRGTFRSVLIPMRSSGGHLYISGADINIDVLKGQIREEAYEHFGISLLLIVLSFPVFLWMLHLIRNAEIEETAEE